MGSAPLGTGKEVKYFCFNILGLYALKLCGSELLFLQTDIWTNTVLVSRLLLGCFPRLSV